jgi:hypothetical protein
MNDEVEDNMGATPTFFTAQCFPFCILHSAFCIPEEEVVC